MRIKFQKYHISPSTKYQYGMPLNAPWQKGLLTLIFWKDKTKPLVRPILASTIVFPFCIFLIFYCLTAMLLQETWQDYHFKSSGHSFRYVLKFVLLNYCITRDNLQLKYMKMISVKNDNCYAIRFLEIMDLNVMLSIWWNMLAYSRKWIWQPNTIRCTKNKISSFHIIFLVTQKIILKFFRKLKKGMERGIYQTQAHL